MVRRFRRGPGLIKTKGERHKHNGRLPFTRSNNRNISTFRKGRKVEIQSLTSNLTINKRPTLGFDFRTSFLVKLEKPAWPEHIQNTAFWPDNVLYYLPAKTTKISHAFLAVQQSTTRFLSFSFPNSYYSGNRLLRIPVLMDDH